MTTITHGGRRMPASPSEGSTSGRLLISCLILWVVLGPVAGILYENHVNAQAWFELAALPALQQDAIKAAYFSDAALNAFGGAIVWFAGVAILAILGMRNRA
jgi:hypothetical protein